ncbi:MAG: hypothetical protein JOZ78_14195 [Chroococcidiopsidaceae cyanobacterium CP_BM_ER_R8_30]|nr:hypothetical protein [Chroococcidiopsidaceae cyanobacterium CP_BM_ER_R8_30]
MTLLHLLAEYEALVQQHREQFTPTLTQLQASVNETLHQIRQQERSLVDAQVQQLAQLQGQLATNARCLLNSVELQAFVAEVQATPALVLWHQNEPLLEVDANSANWQLAQTDLTLAIRDYEATVEHDAYDDERTYTTYGYRVTIQLDDQSRRIEVLTQRVYSPVKQHPYSLREQLYYYFEDAAAELLSRQEMDMPRKKALRQEISYLLGCASRLLQLAPQKVQFQYSSMKAATFVIIILS